MRMVLVDEDDDLRRTMCDSFRLHGWGVSEARNLRSAIDAALTAQPHVIVTELLLPGAREYHFVRALRSSVEHDLVIVGVTRSSPNKFADAKLAGFDMVFEKPIDIAHVHRSIIASIPPEIAMETRATAQMPRVRG